MKLLSFGEIIWDVYPEKACLGGAPLNVAAHAARHGMNVSMLSAVGDDALGKRALAQLRDLGVNSDAVCVHTDLETGVCDVTLDERSVPTYHLREDVAWDRIVCDTALEADVLYFGTLALRCEYNRLQLHALLTAQRFDEVFVDINLRAPFYSAQTIRFACEHATLLKVSDEELPVMCDLLGLPQAQDPMQTLQDVCARFKQLRLVLYTCGADGAYAYDVRGAQTHRVDAVPTTAVSTVGAGDSFSAAFLAHFLRGEPLEKCLCQAAKLAAFVVAHHEAVPLYSATDIE